MEGDAKRRVGEGQQCRGVVVAAGVCGDRRALVVLLKIIIVWFSFRGGFSVAVWCGKKKNRGGGGLRKYAPVVEGDIYRAIAKIHASNIE